MFDDLHWIQTTERGMLELAYITLLKDYKNLKDKVVETKWEDRSGGQFSQEEIEAGRGYYYK